jgi:LmbE family N-acetylglucosaminyl deacetylase
VSTFDGQLPGTSERAWQECAWLRAAPELETLTGTRLVVLSAHPDDETLGAAGLIGLAADTGLDVHVIVASDGAGSHPRSRTHSPARLAALRKNEVADAMATLAPQATLEFLGLPDGELAAHAGELCTALRRACSGDTVLLAPWAHDRHPDHEACARAARAVVAAEPGIELLEFPIWAWHWAARQELAELDPEAAATRRLTLGAERRERKQAAIACFPSQIQPLSADAGDEAVVGPDSLAYFARDFECFLVITPAGT